MLDNTEATFKNEQCIDTGTISHTRHRKKTNKCNAENINVRENGRGNQEWAIQRHGQHWVHKEQDEDKINQNNNTENMNPGAREQETVPASY
jgi:hypothetical protein